MMEGIDPTTAGSVDDLWAELNLGKLLDGVKETNKKSSMGLNQVGCLGYINLCFAFSVFTPSSIY
jgi:hypothetical protein